MSLTLTGTINGSVYSRTFANTARNQLTFREKVITFEGSNGVLSYIKHLPRKRTVRVIIKADSTDKSYLLDVFLKADSVTCPNKLSISTTANGIFPALSFSGYITLVEYEEWDTFWLFTIDLYEV